MVNIDEIMEMIDWNSPYEVQMQGVGLASEIKTINVFLQPHHPGCHKNVWENCALILSKKQDEEIKPYLYELLRWLMDMNWPGAKRIYDRLLEYKEKSLLIRLLSFCKDEAIRTEESQWVRTLSDFDRDYNQE